MTQSSHLPVMVDQVVEAMAPQTGEYYVDGTFGQGGYSRALLRSGDQCKVWGIDRDPTAVQAGQALEQEYPQRFHILYGCFGQMDSLLAERHISHVDGIALDLGVSSPQLDQKERGFSFRLDGPLDMRMDPALKITAADLVNTLPEQELADIILTYGEERYARKIAREIVQTRKKKPLERTLELAELVHKIVPRERRSYTKQKFDPATRTFQALRIKVNDELGELERGLLAAERLLSPGGRLVVVSFHSLEDACVKKFLRQRIQSEAVISRHLPVSKKPLKSSSFKLLYRRALRPSSQEQDQNPRARSARLRAAIRTAAPVFTQQGDSL